MNMYRSKKVSIFEGNQSSSSMFYKVRFSPIITQSFLALSFLMLYACSGQYTKEDLRGAWTVKSWVEFKSKKTISAQMDMTFNPEGKYVVDYGTEKEEGKFWVENDYLHTVENGKAEKKVKIIKLNIDSLVIEMNRAGSIEQVVLVRE